MALNNYQKQKEIITFYKNWDGNSHIKFSYRFNRNKITMYINSVKKIHPSKHILNESATLSANIYIQSVMPNSAIHK